MTTLQAMSAVLMGTLSTPFSQRSVNALRSSATAIGDNYLLNEKTAAWPVIAEAALAAKNSAETDVNAPATRTVTTFEKELLSQSEDFLLTSIRAQVIRDVETLVQRYREFAIEAQIFPSANKTIAAMDRVNFEFMDRTGRVYSSTKYIRTTWRQTLVSLAAEFYLIGAISNGATSVTVQNPDPENQWVGFEFNLTDYAQSMTSFLDVRDEIFHPNSNATLKAVI